MACAKVYLSRVVSTMVELKSEVEAIKIAKKESNEQFDHKTQQQLAGLAHSAG
jgi:hypothetical protein